MQNFKNYLKKNIYLLYSAQILNGLRFIAPVWVLFFLHYISFTQLALLESIGLFVSVGLELPTGVLADLVGRKNTIIFGYIISGIGSIIIGFGHSFIFFLIGYIVTNFGSSFVSGADTALLFDTLKEHDVVDDYAKYSGKIVFIFRFAIIVAMVVGQYLYAVFIGLPYVAMGLAAIAAGLIYIFVREPTREKQKITLSLYVGRTKEGFKEAFRNNATTKLSLYFISIASIELMLLWFYYAPYLSWLGYTPKNIGWIYAGVATTRMIASLYSRKIEKVLGARNLLLSLPVLLGLTLLFGFIRNIYIGTALLFIHYSFFTLRYTVLDKYTNLRFDSTYRASAISSLNMFVSLIYAVIILVFSNIITLNNVGVILSIFGAVLLVISLPIGYFFTKAKAAERVSPTL